jgi:hypothetical protein
MEQAWMRCPSCRRSFPVRGDEFLGGVDCPFCGTEIGSILPSDEPAETVTVDMKDLK